MSKLVYTSNYSKVLVISAYNSSWTDLVRALVQPGLEIP